ncbi:MULTISPECIES: ABC transporter substrate-binding protein [unclassified Azospirillum]|uniref:ABC transporter substrate-binding protein n=1 Tax=unclassified Azospirillum TaxID=2630922 RepID=UPI000B69845F|nr:MULTISPECIES: ABC transporter substrate-binding protein [unclassified Azospirillum]SNS96060.1 ABC-type transport system, substrate-binding protein [Azospirillum sp. RU38E]SNT12369.1 ABC-type transport system, substrate-binding protein [Azospirillum sp. RU37A]
MPGKTSRIDQLLLVFISLLSALPAFGTSAETSLRIGLDFVAASADPHAIAAPSSHTLAFHIFEPLVMWDGDDRIKPVLAQEWRREGPTRWSFTLRSDVRFHDGHPLGPEDLAFTFCRLARLEGQLQGLIYNILKTQAVGQNRVQIDTRSPMSNLPRQLSRLAIIGAPPGWRGDYAAEGCPPTNQYKAADFNAGRVPGSGPYRLTGFKAGTSAVLQRYPGYWGEAPAWDRVEMIAIPEGAERARAVISRKVDIINRPPLESTSFFDQHPNTRIVTGGISRTLFLLPNTRKRTGAVSLDNPAVRQAISAAIDRRGLADRLMGGLALPAFQPLPPDDPAYPGLREELPTPPPGTRLPQKLEITTPPTFRRVADGVARYLRLAGVQVDIRDVPSEALPGLLESGDYDMMMLGRVMFDGDLVQQTRDTLATRDSARGTGAGNSQGYSNAELDGLVERAMATEDKTERAALTRQISTLVMRELPTIPLLHIARSWAMNADLGYLDQPDGLTLAANVVPLVATPARVR